MKRPTVYLSVVIVILVAIIIGLLSRNKEAASLISEEKVTIPIGFIGPLSGDAASYGLQQQNAVQMAFEEISSLKEFSNIEFNLIYEDAKCAGKDAHTAVSKLINIDKISYVLGGICSSETLGAAALFEQHDVLDFTWGSSPDISELGEYVFRNSPSDKVAGKVLAAKVFDDGHRRVAILTSHTDFTKAFMDVFKEQFTALGGEIIIEEVAVPGEDDFRVLVTKIKASNPDAVTVLHQDGPNSGRMVRQLREQRVDTQLYSAYVFESQEAIDSAGHENAKGLIYVNAPVLDTSNEEASAFIEKYVDLYGGKPLASEFYAAAAYDTAYVIAGAIKECFSDVTCAQEHLHDLTYSGTLGEYSFDERGDVVGVDYIIQEVE